MTISLSMELRRAWRRLLRAPGFSLSVIVLIAFSIGGVAAVATAGWSLFARPLPYSQADQLVTVSGWYKRIDTHMGLSAALVEELNREQQYGTLAIVERPFQLRLVGGRGVRAARIDHRLLGVLRIAPLAGRVLTAQDVAPDAQPVALISERFWRQHLGGDSGAIGRIVDFEDGRVRIVGVLPDRLSMPESNTDFWLPMELGPEKLSPDRYTNLRTHTIVARVANGVELETYRTQLLTRLRSDERLGSRSRRNDIEFQVRPLRSVWSAGQRNGLLILMAATGVVMLAAWLNLAGLWLARWAGRTRELAIQFALGAPYGLATFGVILEYALLGLPGLVLAMMVSGLGMEMLYALEVLENNGPLRAGFAVPTLMTGFALLACGLLPVLGTIGWKMRRLSRRATGSLGVAGMTGRGDGAGVRKLLTIGQIGIAFSMLIALGLLLTSWLELLDEELGFRSDHLVVAMVSPMGSGWSKPDPNVAAAVGRLGAIPGVQDVAWSNSVPFGGLEFMSGVVVDEGLDEPVPARRHVVGSGFFDVAGINLLSGRVFGSGDAGSHVRNVIVDRAFERRYMNGSALGRRAGFFRADQTVIGVVESVRHNVPDEARNEPTIYTYANMPASQTQLLLQTSVEPDSLIGAVREMLSRDLGPDRVGFVASMDSMIRHSVRDREPQLVLMAVFTSLALILTFYGMYALQSYQVAAGTSEIGLRRVMGASRTRILGAEMFRAVRLLQPGLVLGLVGGWLGMHLFIDNLYKVGLFDPRLWLATGAAIALTIVLASLFPALRAARVEPLDALRYE